MTTQTHPQWIARMYPGKVGRDHLGLQSVSQDQILPRLSPGINVLTHHPRYHSFYIFLLDEFWLRGRSRSQQAFSRFYRPREFIFSIGGHLCDRPEHGALGNIIGSQKTEGLARRSLATYDTTTDYIKSSLGGYGLYYRSVMAELGLIYPGGPGFPTPIDVPTPQGKELAAAFRQAIQNTTYYREYFAHDETHVPITIIKEYIRQACLCQARLPSATDRSHLLDCFLHGGNEHAAAARRRTFRFLLDLVAQTEGQAIDQATFRQLLFFKASTQGARYEPLEATQAVHKEWRMYQAREYYAFALNALWYYLCEWGLDQGGEFHPIHLSHFYTRLQVGLNLDVLASYLGVVPPKLDAQSDFSDLLTWLQRLVNADAASFDTACTLNSPINEHRLYELALHHRDQPEVMIGGMIVLISLIFLRFGSPGRWLEPDWRISQMGADGRLSVDVFVRTLRWRLERRIETIGDMTHWLYTDYVMLQHLSVAASKLPENTYRFQREGDSLHFFRLENTLVFADSRFDALTTTIYELGLCGDFNQSVHALTPEGQQLLVEGDLR